MKSVSLLLLLLGTASAIQLTGKAKRTPNKGTPLNGVLDGHVIALRNHVARENTPIVVNNVLNQLYAATINLGGKDYKVVMDTGSSDLWVYSETEPITTVNTTDILIESPYAIGQASGPVHFADIKLGDYQVQSQAFMNVQEMVNFEEMSSQGIQGILGLSFDSASKIDNSIREAWGQSSTAGRSLISNIFHQDPNISNFITVLLGRAGDLDGEVQGQFTIGEYFDRDGLEAIKEAPKLPRQTVQVPNAADRWNVEVEGICVNGKPTELKSAFPGVKEGSVIGLLDTGYPFPPIHPSIADAIYSSIPGAVKAKDTPVWVVPCLSSTEVVFKIGGKEFPIHPLDLTAIYPGQGSDGSQYTYCTNTFQGNQSLVEYNIEFILGAPFLRNVYAVYDWGNETRGGNEGPFTQLLSTTNLTQANPEFLQVRGEELKLLPAEIPPADVISLLGFEAETVPPAH